MHPVARFWLSIVSICISTNCWADFASVDGWWNAKPESSDDYSDRWIFLTTSGENICAAWRDRWRDRSTLPDLGATVYVGHFSSGRGVIVRRNLSDLPSYQSIALMHDSVLSRYPASDQKEIFMGATNLIIRERFRWTHPIRYDYVIYSRNSGLETVPSTKSDELLCAEAMKNLHYREVCNL